MKPIVTTLAVLLAVAPTVALAQAITVDQKPLYESQAAYYAAVEAKAKAQAATSAALTGAIPAAPATGAVTVKDGAGAAEANILVAQAIIDAADTIKNAIVDADGKIKGAIPKTALSAKVVIFPGGEAPDLSQWLAFRERAAAIKAQLDAVLAATLRLGPPTVTVSAALVPPLDAVGVVVKLAELTFTDRELGNIPVSATDYQLAVAVAGTLPGATLAPTRFYTKTQGIAPALAAADTSMRAVIHKLDTLLPASAAGSSATVAQRAQYATAVRNLATAANNYNDFRALLDLPPFAVPTAAKLAPKPLAATDPAKPAKQEPGKDSPKADAAADKPAAVADTLSLVAVLRQKAITDAIAGGYGLFVKTHAAASSYLTRKGLFASLSPMPIKVSGSVVASYALIDGATDAVAAAGLVGKLHPLQRLDKVSCNVPATSPLCPAKP